MKVPSHRQAETKLAQIQRDQDERFTRVLNDVEARVRSWYPCDPERQTSARALMLPNALHCAGVPETPAEQAVTDQYEMGLRASEIVDRYYDGPGRIIRALYWSPEELKPQIMRWIERMSTEHMRHFASGSGERPIRGVTHGDPPLPPETGITATLSNRLNERWPLVNDQAFADVIEIARNQPWCDLQLWGTGNCISHMETSIRHKMPDWSPIPMPFDVGSIIVVGSVCYGCWDRFSLLYQLGDTYLGEPFDSIFNQAG